MNQIDVINLARETSVGPDARRLHPCDRIVPNSSPGSARSAFKGIHVRIMSSALRPGELCVANRQKYRCQNEMMTDVQIGSVTQHCWISPKPFSSSAPSLDWQLSAAQGALTSPEKTHARTAVVHDQSALCALMSCKEASNKSMRAQARSSDGQRQT